MVVEVAVLVLGLIVALVRITRGPALFPLRLLAIVYADVFRGIPTILLIYLIGFGVPALGLDGRADRPRRARRVRPRCSPTAPTSPRSTGRGSARFTASQRDGALAIGLTERQALRHVVIPQGVRRVGPPLLNDFISLQKDVALISILGVAGEAFRTAQIETSFTFNFTPLVGAAMLYICVTIPLARLLDHWERQVARCRRGGRPAHAARRPGARDPRRHQVVRRPRGPARDRTRDLRARGGCPDRRLGVGQVDPAALRRPARRDRRRRRLPRRRGDDRPDASMRSVYAGAWGWCSRPTTCSRI